MWVLTLVALLLAAGAARATPGIAQPAVPRFETAACHFKRDKSLTPADVRCGYLIVPEDRAVSGGPTIKLAVAVFKNPSTTMPTDAFVFLQGGPGGGIVGGLGPEITRKDGRLLGPYIAVTAKGPGVKYLRLPDRDLVLIDQRGTGLSRPALSCPEITRLQKQTRDQNVSPAKYAVLEEAAVRRCHDRLVKAHITLNAYTTEENAADIADLRTALGYQSVDLYGGSYGTRLALTVMRLHPAGIRSVVLDSVVPPEKNLSGDALRAHAHYFQQLFQGCAQAPTCSRLYPHLATTFSRLVTRLDAKPIMITATDLTTGKKYKALVTGQDLGDVVVGAGYSTWIIPFLPAMIAEAWDRQYARLAAVYSFASDVGSDVNVGMYYSVECGEDAAFETVGQIRKAAGSLPAQLRSSNVVGEQAFLEECKTWHVKKVDPAQKQAVSSDIPTLVLEGQYDPITPPANGALAAGTLGHSYSFVFPGMGHGVFLSDPCPTGIIAAFVAQPSQAPDASCIKAMSPPFP